MELAVAVALSIATIVLAHRVAVRAARQYVTETLQGWEDEADELATQLADMVLAEDAWGDEWWGDDTDEPSFTVPAEPVPEWDTTTDYGQPGDTPPTQARELLRELLAERDTGNGAE